MRELGLAMKKSYLNSELHNKCISQIYLCFFIGNIFSKKKKNDKLSVLYPFYYWYNTRTQTNAKNVKGKV